MGESIRDAYALHVAGREAWIGDVNEYGAAWLPLEFHTVEMSTLETVCEAVEDGGPFPLPWCVVSVNELGQRSVQWFESFTEWQAACDDWATLTDGWA